MFFGRSPDVVTLDSRASQNPSSPFHAEDLAAAARPQPVRSPRLIVPRTNDIRGGSAGAGVRP